MNLPDPAGTGAEIRLLRIIGFLQGAVWFKEETDLLGLQVGRSRVWTRRTRCQNLGLGRIQGELGEQSRNFLQKREKKKNKNLEKARKSREVTGGTGDRTCSRSCSRIWSWLTTAKTVRVSWAFPGRPRSGLHLWIWATVALMDPTLCSTIWKAG